MSNDRAYAIVNTMLMKQCWHVSFVGTAESTFKLFVGDKIPRREPVNNHRLPETVRMNDSECGIIVYCAWRLDGPSGPIASWLEAYEEESNDPTTSALSSIINQSIINITITELGFDIEIMFTGDFTLRVFCDATDRTANKSNWHSWNRRENVTIKGAGHMHIEQREDGSEKKGT